jgi:hypothetical protein
MITYEGGKMCAGEEEKMENSGFGVEAWRRPFIEHPLNNLS